MAALSLAGYDLDLNVVAALLTVAGYSVNDTIVIFDRVRERVGSMGREAIGAAVNAAVADTLGRTIMTSGTTLTAVLALYLFGGTVLEGFAFTLLVGIVAGTWSTCSWPRWWRRSSRGEPRDELHKSNQSTTIAQISNP